MCLLIVIRDADGSLLVAANRDEAYDRPARGPFVWDATPPLLAGRDERAGGTWLAVNAAGVLAAVTNRRGAAPDDPARPSRGQLPLRACARRSAREALEALRGHLHDQRYNGFNLLIADARDVFIIESADRPTFQTVPPGAYALGNDAWDDRSDLRVARAHHLLRQPALQTPSAGLSRRLAALADLCRDHAPLGLGRSLCLHRPTAGTVSSTLLALGADGALRAYRHAAGPPCRHVYADLAGVLKPGHSFSAPADTPAPRRG